MIAGDLLTEPAWRIELLRLLLGDELDLGDDQAFQFAAVDIHLDLVLAVGNDMAALLEPSPFCERPELIEGRPVDPHLGLLPCEPGPTLCREQQLLALA